MAPSPADRRPGSRRGSLYVELLIVTTIVGVLLAVMIPSLMRARSAARRVQCLNNLKNLSLALQVYSEQHQTFPPGYIVRDVDREAPATEERGPGWGWCSMILPQLEQQALYRTFDFRLDVAGGATLISPLLCPEDQSAVFSVTSSQFGLVSLPPANFVGVAGRGSLSDEPGRPAYPGMFYRNSAVRIDDVSDGISNTLLLGERKSFTPNDAGETVDTSSTWLGAVSGVFRDPGYAGESRVEGPGSLVLGVVGQLEPVPLKIPPNGSPPGIGFSSSHPGGAQFSRVDGSCSYISEKIDIDLFVRLGQRADNEPPGVP